MQTKEVFVTAVLAGVFLCALNGCAGATAAASGAGVTTSSNAIWVAAWADSPDSLGGSAGAEQTFREVVKPTVGSRGTVRLHFSNFFGTSPVTLGAVHVGVQRSGPSLSSDVAVTFSGVASVTIPAGGFATSDQASLSFNYGDVLEVSEYVSGSWSKLTQHNQADSNVTSYATVVNAGNVTSDTGGTSFTQTIFQTLLLDRVDVYGAYKGTIAAFGGSTTNGMNSGLNQHSTYPEQLAAALHSAGRDDVAIANEGISGDTVLGTGATAGVSRFSRDVLGLPGIAGVIDYLGANDLRVTCVTAAAVIAGKQNLIAQAHAAGLKIYEAVIAPSTFCGAQNPGGFGTRFAQGSGEEAQRPLLNGWIASTQNSTVNGTAEAPPGADAVIDFNAPLVDPANTSYMLPVYDSGDDIHPNATGYGVMARAVPLTLF